MSGKISIMVEMMPEKVRPQYKATTVADKVQYCIDEIETGKKAAKEWKFLKRLFDRLAKKDKLTKKQKTLFDKIEPVIQKYGQLDPDGTELSATYPHEKESPSG